jgi:hypothetical protein
MPGCRIEAEILLPREEFEIEKMLRAKDCSGKPDQKLNEGTLMTAHHSLDVIKFFNSFLSSCVNLI